MYIKLNLDWFPAEPYGNIRSRRADMQVSSAVFKLYMQYDIETKLEKLTKLMGPVVEPRKIAGMTTHRTTHE